MDLQEVTEIDNQINYLHSELVDLYQKRASYAGLVPPPALQTSYLAELFLSDDQWVAAQYAQLALAWSIYDIKLPALRLIRRKLVRSRRVMTALASADSRLVNKLGVLLVPPSNLLDFPNHGSLRAKQAFIERSDFLDPEAQARFNQKDWQVIVAYTHPDALRLGSAQDIFETKAHIIAGFDSRALGILEHVALSLQLSYPIDHNAWTLLLKGYKKNDSRQIPSAMLFGAQYRFELDDPAGVLGLERFRPAVEIVLKDRTTK